MLFRSHRYGRLMIRTLLLFGLCFSLMGQGKQPSVEDTIMQLEREWSAADIAKDAATLDRILADDWNETDYEGHLVTKAMVLSDIKNNKTEVSTITNNDRKIRVFGNVAIVTGRDTEKSVDHGKETSGTYVYTDVFLNRNGKWQAVQSHSTKLQ